MLCTTDHIDLIYNHYVMQYILKRELVQKVLLQAKLSCCKCKRLENWHEHFTVSGVPNLPFLIKVVAIHNFSCVQVIVIFSTFLFKLSQFSKRLLTLFLIDYFQPMRAANSDFMRCSIPKAKQNHDVPPALAANGQLELWSISQGVRTF